MAKKAIITGSNGYVTKTVGTDIIAEIKVAEGLTGGYVPAKSFEMYAKDDVGISINGRQAFTLMAGTEIEEKEDEIETVEILTADAEFYFYVKF